MQGISRRTLLAGSVGAKVCLGAKQTMLAFSLYGMKGMPLLEAIRACQNIGYEGVSLCVIPGWPADPLQLSRQDRTQLKLALSSSGITPVSLQERLTLVVEGEAQLLQLDRLRRAADLGLELKAPLIETVLGGKPEDWYARDRMADRLREWVAIAARRGVTLCVKAEIGAAVNSPDKLLWLHKSVGSPFLKFAYDYSHFQLAGLSPESTMKQLMPSTRIVHLNDAAGTAAKPRFLLPGDGMLDFKEHVRLLRKFGYRGWVVAEASDQVQSQTGYHSVRAAQRCFERLRPVVE